LLPGFSIYEDEESRGVEYPTSIGRIDVLAINEKDKEILVIELKSGIASTDALKILSYMQWVEENLAEGRKVKGLIIAQDLDDKLKYALRRIPDVQSKNLRWILSLDEYLIILT
jgi:RecB family endonuclease NucS